MQDDAELIRRIHPGNRAEVFIWQNFQPAYRDPGWKEPSQLFEHIENFTIDSEVRRDLGNRPSRAHMKRPLVCVAGARKLRESEGFGRARAPGDGGGTRLRKTNRKTPQNRC